MVVKHRTIRMLYTGIYACHTCRSESSTFVVPLNASTTTRRDYEEENMSVCIG
jgi:hypothetical protein